VPEHVRFALALEALDESLACRAEVDVLLIDLFHDTTADCQPRDRLCEFAQFSSMPRFWAYLLELALKLLVLHVYKHRLASEAHSAVRRRFGLLREGPCAPSIHLDPYQHTSYMFVRQVCCWLRRLFPEHVSRAFASGLSARDSMATLHSSWHMGTTQTTQCAAALRRTFFGGATTPISREEARAPSMRAVSPPLTANVKADGGSLPAFSLLIERPELANLFALRFFFCFFFFAACVLSGPRSSGGGCSGALASCMDRPERWYGPASL